MNKEPQWIVACCASLACVAALIGAANAATIIVNQLDDVPMGTWSGLGDMVQTMSHCSGPSSSRYRVTATGSGTGGAFTLSSGTSTLAYKVEYAGRTGGFTQLSPGIALTGLNGDTQAQCVGLSRQSERVRITILAATLAAAPAGSYSGTLTLTVAPE